MNAKKEIEREMLQYRVRADFTERTCNTIEASLERLYQMGYEEGRKESYEPCGICHSTECRGIHNY